MFSASWRKVYVCTIALRFVAALSDSYIHPDEHFQTFEVLTHSLLGFNTNQPWEFTSESPARSIGPLFLFYYGPLKLAQWLGFSPLQTWYLSRLVLMVSSWMITDWCLYKMLPTKQERVKAIYFVATSYVSLVYQSHTFSNSVETVLVVSTVYMLNELRYLSGIPPIRYTAWDVARLSVGTGICFGIGFFNRVTFPAFFILPVVFLLPCIFKWLYSPVLMATGFLTVAGIFTVADTIYFKDITLSEVLHNPFDFSQYVVTPLNNLIYNTKLENLAHHGIHPYYQHVLVNLPQILGPGIVFLLPRFKNSYWKTTPFLAAVSGLLFLSAVPHQELRFLVPVVPLFCSCFDLNQFEKWSRKYTWLMPLLMNIWLVFNGALFLLMGSLHQAGVVLALDHLKELYQADPSGLTIIWWRTYSPPSWVLGNKWSTTQMISLHDEKLDYSLSPDATNYIIDAMGMDYENLQPVIDAFVSKSEQVYLVTPIASYNEFFGSSDFNETWTYKYHVDMDHLNFMNPGIGIYSLL